MSSDVLYDEEIGRIINSVLEINKSFFFKFIIFKIMDRAGTIMEDYRLKERSSNFSNEEKNRLQLLVDKHKNVLMCKKTDGSSVKQKDAAWCSIEKEFNAIGQTPRNIKQLKYKFENMKRCAKKEASRERQEMIRTGGGKPPSLPPQSEEATDWLRSIMSGSIDGNEAVYDDDVITPNSVSTPKINKNNPDGDDILSNPKKAKRVININDFDETMSAEENAVLDDNVPIIIDCNNESQINIVEAESAPIFDSSAPHSSLRKPMAPQLKRMMKKKQNKGNKNIINQALKEKKLSVLEGLHDLELEKIRQIIRQQAELHEQLMQHNEEKHKLEMIKIQLEINLLEDKKRGTSAIMSAD